MARMKPERVISAQVDLYRDRLKKKCKENELKKKMEEEEMDENMTRDSLDDFLEGDGIVVYEPSVEIDLTIRTGTLRDCIGKRCQLENRHKQFMSHSAGTRTGAKKCPSCQQFEPALKKVLKLEEYIIGQLKEPTDDIDKLLRGLSQLMEDSKGGKGSRATYYD